MNNKRNNYSSLYNKSVFPRISDVYQVTYIDTLKVAQIKKDLLNYANEYMTIIARLFDQLRDVPVVTREWIGDKANFYFNVIMYDKTKFLNFGNNLINIVNKLDTDITNVSSSVSKITKLEGEAKYYDKI